MFCSEPPLVLRGAKVSYKRIFIPTEYMYKILSKSVIPFRRSINTKTVPQEFYILDITIYPLL